MKCKGLSINPYSVGDAPVRCQCSADDGARAFAKCLRRCGVQHSVDFEFRPLPAKLLIHRGASVKNPVHVPHLANSPERQVDIERSSMREHTAHRPDAGDIWGWSSRVTRLVVLLFCCRRKVPRTPVRYVRVESSVIVKQQVHAGYLCESGGSKKGPPAAALRAHLRCVPGGDWAVDRLGGSRILAV